MALELKHQSEDQFIERLGVAYRAAYRGQRVPLSRFVISRIAVGDITDAQCQVAFGLNPREWRELKRKMQRLITAANTVQNGIED